MIDTATYGYLVATGCKKRSPTGPTIQLIYIYIYVLISIYGLPECCWDHLKSFKFSFWNQNSFKRVALLKVVYLWSILFRWICPNAPVTVQQAVVSCQVSRSLLGNSGSAGWGLFRGREARDRTNIDHNGFSSETTIVQTPRDAKSV